MLDELPLIHWPFSLNARVHEVKSHRFKAGVAKQRPRGSVLNQGPGKKGK